MKIICVAGARPNFMKIAPLMAAFAETPGVSATLVHTGQHYDREMSQLFFTELDIPEPGINLEVGSASHAVQTADIMVKFEKVLRKKQPDAVLVVGDVNSTIACGLVAVQMGIKLIHVEAGLRSFDRTMPEEINRLLTDAISDILFCSEKSGVDNLRNEGIPEDRIHLVGNVMIDTLLSNRDKAERSSVLSDLELQDRHYAAVTLHRPSNVDDPAVLSRLVGVLRHISADMPVAFPVHPRTRKNLEESGEDMGTDVRLVDPLGYLDFLKLMTHSRLVLTDSGGIQEETTILGVPCLTLREQTERPVTVEMGTNRVVGTSPEKILSAYEEAISSPAGNARKPPLWDGKASERIVKAIAGM